MSNSSLASYTRLSPNCSSRGGQKIRKITPHHMAGNLSVETCGSVFAPTSRQASSNYGIGSDGRIALYVDESKRAWTSSNAANDKQAVTIEVANDEIGGNWHVSDKAFESLVNLCVDICQRNGMTGLKWTGDASGTLTNHDMFIATNCCGPYLKSRMPDLCNEVNKRLGNGYTPIAPQAPATSNGSEKTGTGFGGRYVCQADGCRVRCAPSLSGQIVASYNKGQSVTIDDWYVIADGYVWGRYTGASSGQKRYIAIGKPTGGPDAGDLWLKEGSSVASAPSPAKKTAEQVANEIVQGVGGWGNYPERKTKLEAAGYSYSEVQALVNKKLGAGSSSAPAQSASTIAVGSTVRVTNPVDCNGTHLAVSGTYTVMEVSGDRIVIGRGGVVTAAVNRSNLALV